MAASFVCVLRLLCKIVICCHLLFKQSLRAVRLCARLTYPCTDLALLQYSSPFCRLALTAASELRQKK